jgi:hypothetical protein
VAWLSIRGLLGVSVVLGLIETAQGAPSVVKGLKDAGVTQPHTLAVILAAAVTLILGLVFALLALGPERVKHWLALARGQDSPVGAVTAPELQPQAPTEGESFAERFPGIHRAVQQLPAIAETADALLRAPEPSAPSAQKSEVSPEHRDMLQGVARTLRSYVNATQHAYYGAKGDERKAQSFAEHFLAVTKLVSEWNKQIAAFEAERRELREWVEERLRALAYDRPPFSWGCAGVISGSAEAEDAELPFHVTPLQPLWLELGPWPVIPDPPPNGRTRRDIEDELRAVLSEAVEQPQRERIRQIRSSLSEASEALIEGLDLIAEKDVINGLGDCLLCR